MSFDFKVATPDPSITDDNSGLFGADSQTASTPSWYSFGTIKAWIKSWLTPADAGFFKTYKAGSYYIPFGYRASSSVPLSAANRIHFYPFMVPQKCTISEFFLRVSTGSSGNWQAAVYAADANTQMPTGMPLAKSNASGSTTTGPAQVTTVLNTNYQLVPGVIYWIGVNADNAIAAFVTIDAAGCLFSAAALIGNTDMSKIIIGGGAVGVGYYVDSQTLGTWGDMTSATFVAITGNPPALVGFKITSVP